MLHLTMACLMPRSLEVLLTVIAVVLSHLVGIAVVKLRRVRK